MSSDLGNKEVMAENIKYYMAIHNVNSVDMCKILHVAQSTFSYWVNAKYYPRIDKIEQMANYFHISKADLVEKRKIPATSGDGLEAKHNTHFTVAQQKLINLFPDLTEADVDVLLATAQAQADSHKPQDAKQ